MTEDVAITRGTSRSKSLRGSVGGKGIAKQRMPGSGALIGAPRPYAPSPVRIKSGTLKTSANNRRQAEQAAKRRATELCKREARSLREASGLFLRPPTAKPLACGLCGIWFPSRNERGRHMAGCVREGAD